MNCKNPQMFTEVYEKTIEKHYKKMFEGGEQ